MESLSTNLRQLQNANNIPGIDQLLLDLSYGFLRGEQNRAAELLCRIDPEILRETMRFVLDQKNNFDFTTTKQPGHFGRRIISIANSVLGAIYLYRNQGDKLRKLVDPAHFAMLCEHLASGDAGDISGSFHAIYAMIDDEEPQYNILRSMAISVRAVPGLLDQTDPETYVHIFDIDKIQALHDDIPITLDSGQPAPDEVRIAIASSQKARLSAFGLITALWYGDQTLDSKFADAFSDGHIEAIRTALDSQQRIIRNDSVIKRLKEYLHQK